MTPASVTRHPIRPVERRRHLPIWHAVVAAAAAVVLGLFVPAVLAIVAWIGASAPDTSPGQALAVGVDGWALAHGALVRAGGLDVRGMPLLLTAGLWWLTARLAGRVLDDHPVPDEGRLMQVGWLAGSFLGTYAVTGLLAIVAANASGGHVPWWSAAPGLVILPALAFAWAMHRAGALRELVPQPWRDRGATWPGWIRRAGAPARDGARALVLFSAVALVALSIVRITRIMDLHTSLYPGIVGSVVLVMVQLAAGGNILAWTTGWASGAGLAVGEVEVSFTTVSGGALPGIPALGLLPPAGPLPGWTIFALAIPVLAGAVTGWRASAAWTVLASWEQKILTGAVAALVVALGAGAVIAASSIAVTPGRLAHTGSHALLATGALALELVIGAIIGASLRHVMRHGALTEPASRGDAGGAGASAD